MTPKLRIYVPVGIAVILAGIQFIPKGMRDKQESHHMISLNNDAKLALTRACFDCHSYETRWPWYSYLAPISMLVERDVKLARARLNFSEWEDLGENRKKKLADKIIKSIEEDTMPLWSYAIMHPEAKLDDNDKEIIKKAMGQFTAN